MSWSFRIASVGGVCPEVRHPFPVTHRAGLCARANAQAVLFQERKVGQLARSRGTGGARGPQAAGGQNQRRPSRGVALPLQRRTRVASGGVLVAVGVPHARGARPLRRLEGARGNGVLESPLVRPRCVPQPHLACQPAKPARQSQSAIPAFAGVPRHGRAGAEPSALRDL